MLCSFARATTRTRISQNGRASRHLRIVEVGYYIATITEIRRSLSERSLLLLVSGIPVCQARVPSTSSTPNADQVLGIYIGVDISSELSTVSSEMHLITRSGAWIWPRFIFGQPYESYLGNPHPSIVKEYTPYVQKSLPSQSRTILHDSLADVHHPFPRANNANRLKRSHPTCAEA